MKKYILILFFIFLWLNKVYATPNNSMDISPSATDNTVITADDENDRNTEISSKYNAHGHPELTYTAESDSPYIKYDSADGKWTISIHGTSVSVSIHSNAIFIHDNAAKLYIAQPDGGCSACGVDDVGTTWTCENVVGAY